MFFAPEMKSQHLRSQETYLVSLLVFLLEQNRLAIREKGMWLGLAWMTGTGQAACSGGPYKVSCVLES